MSSVAPLDRFHQNFLSFFDLLSYYLNEARTQGIPTFPAEAFVLIKNLAKNMDKNQLIETFVQKTHDHWDMIHESNEDFFIKHAHELFHMFSQQQVDQFKLIFTEKVKGKPFLSLEDRKSIWEYVHSLIKTSIKHIHQKREPASRIENGVTLKGYRVKYLPEIDLTGQAALWKIELVF